jgi:hypothetical protein
MDSILTDEERRKKNALDLVVKTMDGAPPADPIRDAADRDIALRDYPGQVKMPEPPAGQPSGFMSGLRDAFSISKLNEAQAQISQRNLDEASARGERVVNLDNFGYNVGKFVEDRFGATGNFRGQEYRPVLSGADPTTESAPVVQASGGSGAPSRELLAGSMGRSAPSPSVVSPPSTVPAGVAGDLSARRDPLNRPNIPGMTSAEMRTYRGETALPAAPNQDDNSLSAAADRAMAAQRERVADGFSGSLMGNSGDAQVREQLLDYIDANRGKVAGASGQPMLDDATAMRLMDLADQTNSLNRANTNLVPMRDLAIALGHSPRTAERGSEGGDPYKVSAAIAAPVRPQPLTDWLGTIAKGTGVGVGKENLKQEEIATGQKTNEAASKAIDLKQQQDAQTGDIQAQNIINAQKNVIGYHAGGKDHYLSPTELETMREGTGNLTASSGYQSPGAKAPAAAPAPVQKAATDYKPGETVVRNGVTFVKRSDGKWESQ